MSRNLGQSLNYLDKVLDTVVKEVSQSKIDLVAVFRAVQNAVANAAVVGHISRLQFELDRLVVFTEDYTAAVPFTRVDMLTSTNHLIVSMTTHAYTAKCGKTWPTTQGYLRNQTGRRECKECFDYD